MAESKYYFLSDKKRYLNFPFKLKEVGWLPGHYYVHKNAVMKDIYVCMTCNATEESCTEKKLEKAKHLLTDSNLNNIETARQCGFDNVKYFYNWFRKNFNMTTREYKLAQQNRQSKLDMRFGAKCDLCGIEKHLQ